MGNGSLDFANNVRHLTLTNRGGVLEDVLGLEDAFWSPWPRRLSPWPLPRSLKFSKIALSSAQGQHFFWTVEILLENARNLAENLRRPFLPPSIRDRLKKIFEHLLFGDRLKKFFKTFFFFFLKNTFACVLGLEHSCPWPWKGLSSEELSLASDFFVSLTSSLVSSTPPLLTNFV